MSTTFPCEAGRFAGGSPTAAVVAGASTRAQRSHGEDRKASGERLAESEPHSTSSVSGPSIPSFGARNVIAVRRPRKANDRGLTQHQWRVLSVGGAGAGAQLSNAVAMLPKSASCRAVPRHATPSDASAWRQTLLASDQHIMRAGERHEPLLPESKPSPGTRHRYRADGEALPERKHRYRPAALSAILLRHSSGRLKNGELQCVSTPCKLRAISSQAFSLLACGGLLSAELLHLLFEH